MFDVFKETVAVTFVDHDTGEPIARSDVPVPQLPDTFLLHTELDLVGDKYIVIHAEPSSKAEFSKSKQLTVRLRRVLTVDPRTILFSLPSICGSALPDIGIRPTDAGTMVLHEDDWRQCEFISMNQIAQVDAELGAIRDIHANHAANHGWHEIHVRNRISSPLPIGLRWVDVIHALPPASPLDSVSFGDSPLALEGAVGVRFSDSVVLWGVAPDGVLAALCLENLDSARPETVAALRGLSHRHGLLIVHWCSCRVSLPGAGNLKHASAPLWDLSA